MYAVAPVEKMTSGALECTDDAAWEIYKTEDEAMKAVRENLLCCAKFVAVFKLETIFRVGGLTIEKDS